MTFLTLGTFYFYFVPEPPGFFLHFLFSGDQDNVLLSLLDCSNLVDPLGEFVAQEEFPHLYTPETLEIVKYLIKKEPDIM